MRTITATEFKTNFGKYTKLGQKEVIQVTSRGKLIFEIVPAKEALIRKGEQLIGMLPKDIEDKSWLDRDL